MKLKEIKINSIRTKLIISLVSICVIPLIILGFGSYNQSKTILSNKLTVTSKQTLSEINDGLIDYFRGFSNIVSMTSKNPAIMNIDVDNNNETIINILKGIKESDGDILDIYYGTGSGKFAIYPEVQMPEGYDATTRSWYKLALEHKGQVVITPPYVDAATGNSVVGIAETVEKDGHVVGVIGIDCTLATLSERMSTKKIGNSGYIFIADGLGNILAHEQRELINTDAAAKLEIWEEVKSEDSGFVSYKSDGSKKFGVYQTNQLTGWKLVAILDESELSNDTKSILNTSLLMTLVIAIVAVFLSLFISKGIANNIKKLKEVFSKASNGDLTVSITASTNDEFKELATSFNAMIKNISKLMNSISSSSNIVLETSTSLASMSQEITASINEVAKAIEDVSGGATEQVQNAQKGESEMESLSKRLDEININSNEMDQISNNTRDLSSKGLTMIETLAEKSSKTKMATNDVNDIVHDMNESTKQINAISETISNITEQTNLLALNASIESARAGEAGKGFAVVADEIRKLAEQSKTSTEEIKKIISNIQEKSDTAVKAIKATEIIVDEQESAVDEAHKIFDEILKSIEMMTKKVDEVKHFIIDINEKKQVTLLEINNISLISEQTASASEEVTASTEEITATMEELTNHSNELQLLAGELEKQINNFKVR